MIDALTKHRWVVVFWLIGGLIGLGALGLCVASSYFSYAYRVPEMPVIGLVTGLFATGLIFLLLRFVIARLVQKPANQTGGGRHFIFWIVLLGLLPRLLLMFSEPVLEDDYQRYLWDGGVLVEGFNPYLYSPQNVLDGKVPAGLSALGETSSPLLARINHPELRTIYPPGAALFFAVAAKIQPFSLLAWRGMILLAEIISLVMLIDILKHLKRSPAWLTLYWWNPLVMKELINSAHMEAVLVPFLILTIWAALKQRFGLSLVAVLAAMSIKLWPGLLVPLVLRRLYQRPAVFQLALFFTALIAIFTALPFLQSGLDDSSGLVAYGQFWRTNSALMPLLEGLVTAALSVFSGPVSLASLMARGVIGAGLLLLVLSLVLRPLKGELQFVDHVFLVTLAMLLLSPAQFPWYFVWIAPLLTVYPFWGLLVLVPLMSLYYASFGLIAEGVFSSYRHILAASIWLPVWGALVLDLYHFRRSRLCAMTNT